MKILIADDHPQLKPLMEELLRPWGYETQFAHDGAAALDSLRAAEAPRLALLDWVMPRLDGIEVCRRIRSEPDGEYPYLVLMTGLGGRGPMVEGLEAGADDFLCKPVDPAELRARLTAGRRIVELQERLREMATRDVLTGLWNRAAVLSMLNREMARASREAAPLAVALIDIDHFKLINDTHGHEAGDLVLRETARRMQGTLRNYDAIGRYGGEEFLAILPGCRPGDALALAERLRAGVAGATFDMGGRSLRMSVSVGVASWNAQTDPNALLRAADEALYRAKRTGRDRVVLADALRQLVVS